MQKLNVRIVSFFLILAFSQKLGLELWLHNWLHGTTATTSVARLKGDKPLLQNQLIKCHCLDDTLMPLIGTDMVDHGPVQCPFAPVFATTFSSWLSVSQEFSALRGPPAAGASL
jgi:hypothetical protein